MWITAAYAQAAGAAPPDFVTQMINLAFPLLVAFGFIYIMVLRPQSQRAKQLAQMVANVRRGDIVVTSGGLVGKVTKVIDDNEVQVEIAEGVRVRMMRASIGDVRSKGEPAASDGKSKSDDDK